MKSVEEGYKEVFFSYFEFGWIYYLQSLNTSLVILIVNGKLKYNEKLHYDRFIKLLKCLFVLFRVKLFSEMERGWEPSNLLNSKVGCKQFSLYYVCSFKLLCQLYLFQDVLNMYNYFEKELLGRCRKELNKFLLHV